MTGTAPGPRDRYRRVLKGYAVALAVLLVPGAALIAYGMAVPVPRILGPPAQAMLPADLDGDGRTDIVASGGSYLRNTGAGLEELRSGVDWTQTHFAAADADGDGAAEVCFLDSPEGGASSNYTLSVADRQADGTFKTVALNTTIRAGNQWTRLGASDLDGDTRAEMVVAHSGWNNTEMTFWTLWWDGGAEPAHSNCTIPYTSAVSSAGFSFGDLDGDGDRDVAFGPLLFENAGNGTLVHRGRLGPDLETRYALPCDLDGDRREELVTSYMMNGSFAVHRNRGNWSFETRKYAMVMPTGLAAADVDKDGDADLLVADADDDSLHVFKNDGKAGLSEAGRYAIHGNILLFHGMALADLNSDGNLDLVYIHGRRTHVDLLYGRGGGAFNDIDIASVVILAATGAVYLALCAGYYYYVMIYRMNKIVIGPARKLERKPEPAEGPAAPPAGEGAK